MKKVNHSFKKNHPILSWLGSNVFDRFLTAAQHCKAVSYLLRQAHLNKPEQTESTPPLSQCEKFYQVPLTEDKIHFVDTPEALLQCQKVVLKVF